MLTSRVFKLLWLLFFIEIAASRTVTHYETKIDSDGTKTTKTYTTTDNNDAPQTTNHFLQSSGTSSEPFQTFTRNGGTIRIKPHTETIRIGGTGIPTEDLIKQAGLIKGMDPEAIRELLNTRQPVIRNTTDENGQKRTTTYKLEPDGSISSRSVTEISPAEVDEQFRNLFTNTNKENTADPLANDAEWTTLSQPSFTTRFNRPATNWHTDTNLFPNTNNPTDSWPNGEGIPRTNYKPRDEATTIRLPETWEPSRWHSTKTFTSSNFPTTNFESKVNSYDFNSNPFDSKVDPFDSKVNPFDSKVNPFDSKVNPFDSKVNPFDSTNINVTPGTRTTTHIDENGTKVTTTYTVGPTKTTHTTFNYPAARTWVDREETTPPTTTSTASKRVPIPNLEDFLRSQYATTTTLPTGEFQQFGDNKPVKRINLDELPIMKVLNTNNNNPNDDDYQLVGHDKPIKTIKIENIPRTDQTVETTNVKSLTKTVHTNALPTSADLDPGMRNILEKAGITASEIESLNSDSITKTRVEPDGRVVKTTYTVRTIPPVPTDRSVNRASGTNRRSPINEFGTDDFPRTTYNNPTPSINNNALTPSSTPTPRHFSSSHTYTKFPPTFSSPEIHHNGIEPHPLQQSPTISSYVPLPSGRSQINDFLAKIGLNINDILNQNGEVIKTISDDDGHVLTATFLLSSLKPVDGDNSNVLQRRPIIEHNPLK